MCSCDPRQAATSCKLSSLDAQCIERQSKLYEEVLPQVVATMHKQEAKRASYQLGVIESLQRLTSNHRTADVESINALGALIASTDTDLEAQVLCTPWPQLHPLASATPLSLSCTP